MEKSIKHKKCMNYVHGMAERERIEVELLSTLSGGVETEKFEVKIILEHKNYPNQTSRRTLKVLFHMLENVVP